MAHLYRLIIVLFALLPGLSGATVPIGTGYEYYLGDFSQKKVFPTDNQYCDAAAYFIANSGGKWKSHTSDCRQLCLFLDPSDYCNVTISNSSLNRCPDNSVLVPGTNSCTCDPGFVEEGGQCKHYSSGNSCNGLSDFCSGLKGEKINLEGKGTASPPGCSADSQRPNCAQGCAAEQVGMGVSYKTPDGSWMTGQEYRVTGGTCTLPQPSDVPQKKESDCAGSIGDVNGIRTCVPNQAASGDKTSKETKNSDGTSSNTETKTTCEKGVCTTTTITTNKDSSGTTTSTSSSSSSVSQSSYCASNKSSSVCAATNGDKNPDGKDGTNKDGEKCDGDDCKDKPGKFEGSCAAGFTCEGDAVNCAIAKDQHQRTCALNDTENPFYKLFQSDPGKDKTGSVLGDLKGNKTVNVADYIKDRDDFIGGGACPSDRVIEGPSWQISIPYSKLCPYLEMLGNVVVICASIVGARIITGRAT